MMGRHDWPEGSQMSDEERTFDEFVRARLPHLLRFGRALTGNDVERAELERRLGALR